MEGNMSTGDETDQKEKFEYLPLLLRIREVPG
jgi:hypothetical protein